MLIYGPFVLFTLLCCCSVVLYMIIYVEAIIISVCLMFCLDLNTLQASFNIGLRNVYRFYIYFRCISEYQYNLLGYGIFQSAT